MAEADDTDKLRCCHLQFHPTEMRPYFSFSLHFPREKESGMCTMSVRRTYSNRKKREITEKPEGYRGALASVCLHSIRYGNRHNQKYFDFVFSSPLCIDRHHLSKPPETLCHGFPLLFSFGPSIRFLLWVIVVFASQKLDNAKVNVRKRVSMIFWFYFCFWCFRRNDASHTLHHRNRLLSLLSFLTFQYQYLASMPLLFGWTNRMIREWEGVRESEGRRKWQPQMEWEIKRIDGNQSIT